MKSSTIKSWKYNNINQELNTDTNYKIENDMKQNNLIQLKPNSFRNSSIEGDGLNNENIKLHSNVNLNDDYYNNFLLNLNKTSQEYVTINKKDIKHNNNNLHGSNIDNNTPTYQKNLIKMNSPSKQNKTQHENNNESFFVHRSQSNKNFIRYKFNCGSAKRKQEKFNNIPNHLIIVNNNTNNLINIKKTNSSKRDSNSSNRNNSGSKRIKNGKNKTKNKKRYSVETSGNKNEKSCRDKDPQNKHAIPEKDKEEQLKKIKLTNYHQEFPKSSLSKLKTLHAITGTILDEVKQEKQFKEVNEEKLSNKGCNENINNNNINNTTNNEKPKKKKGFCCLPFLCKYKQ